MFLSIDIILGSTTASGLTMTSFVPQRLDKCWTYTDTRRQHVVKACKFTEIDEENSTTARVTVKSAVNDNGISAFTVPVAKCDPKTDKSGLCTLQIGNEFFKRCDPKKDKKCTINMDEFLFGRK